MRLSTLLIDLAQPKRVYPTKKLTNRQECTKIAAHFDNATRMGAAHRIVSLLAISVMLATSLVFFLLGKETAKAVFFGGAVAVANALFLAWSLRAGARRPAQDVRQEWSWLVRSSLKRFVAVALLIMAGLGWLKLMPVPLLLGFVLGQLILVVSTIISGIEKV